MWSYNSGHAILNSPVLGADNILYIANHYHAMYALYGGNGTVKWQYVSNNFASSAVIAADGSLIAGMRDGRVIAFAVAAQPTPVSKKKACGHGGKCEHKNARKCGHGGKCEHKNTPKCGHGGPC